MFFASSDVNRISVNVPLQQWELPLTINIDDKLASVFTSIRFTSIRLKRISWRP